MRILRFLLFGFLILMTIAAGGFILWGLTPSGPMPEAQAAMQSQAGMTVVTSPWLEFAPEGQQPATGLIFYPGGHVDYRAYAPLARAIAERGYLVVIPPMPLSLAVLSPEAAQAVMAAHPEINTWAVGGHSLGGAMAANFAWKYPGAVQGLVLVAAYPAQDNSLAMAPIQVISIYASEDGLATKTKIDASRSLLPADTIWEPIAGGNHAQFGWYGDQPGDGLAQITRDQQQAQMVDAVNTFLAALPESK
jgi:pimeloyl-ACP methyl ester carboxylesterase